jgi:hypothetical protein
MVVEVAGAFPGLLMANRYHAEPFRLNCTISYNPHITGVLAEYAGWNCIRTARAFHANGLGCGSR